MIQTVSKTELPVGEMLTIQKNRITGGKGEKGKRICIVTGTHGDELEGQYIAYRLASILQNNTDKLDGVVDIYPALNPLGVSTITRGLPQFDLDMNRVFPGTSGGSDYEYTAKQITKDLTGADLILLCRLIVGGDGSVFQLVQTFHDHFYRAFVFRLDFVLTKRIIHPALLIFGLEIRPFLVEFFFRQTLHFCQFVGTAVKAC